MNSRSDNRDTSIMLSWEYFEDGQMRDIYKLSQVGSESWVRFHGTLESLCQSSSEQEFSDIISRCGLLYNDENSKGIFGTLKDMFLQDHVEFSEDVVLDNISKHMTTDVRDGYDSFAKIHDVLNVLIIPLFAL